MVSVVAVVVDVLGVVTSSLVFAVAIGEKMVYLGLI